MKKSILNLGKALNKAEQQTINGGNGGYCRTNKDCYTKYLGPGDVGCVNGRCFYW